MTMAEGRDDLGAVVPETARGARRVVSLVPSLSETLAAWGVVPVGVTEYCIAPEMPDAVRLRGTKNPDVAGIIALAPDLVVANREENRRVDVEALRAAGVAVWVTAPDTLAEVADTLESLGAFLGVEQPSQRLAAAIRSAACPISGLMCTVFCPVWRDPWIAIGHRTIAADLLRVCGLDVVVDADRYPRVELVEIEAADPDVVLLPDEPYRFGDDDAREFATWRAEVHLIDGADLTWWGPRTPGAIERIRALVGTGG